MNRVEVVYGPNGEMYLALRKDFPVMPPPQGQENLNKEREETQETSRVVVIDMFEEDKICYEC